MKYSDHGFRPLYKSFCIYPLNSVIREALHDQPGIEEAEGVMVYGFVDHKAGNSVELIALTRKMDDVRYSFIKLTDAARYFIRVESIADEEFQFIDRKDSPMYEPFQSKVDILAPFDISDEMQKARSLSFLDEFRYKFNFDDVKVILQKEGLKDEGVWVKIESVDNGTFIGTLLNEPKQAFGVSKGSLITFIVNERKDKKKTLISDLNPNKSYNPEELDGGKILKEALRAFGENKNQIKLYEILEILKVSTVFVPQAKKGVEILTSKHKSFYPVFSGVTEMWQYENDITKKEMPFSEVIKKATANEKLSGIVVNAFSDSFIIPRSMFELLEKTESDHDSE